ncbi:hypothetical protein [Chitinophaga sp.]|uniref:hypothetical protein n=1 Tax=Chitinophaga sp. TaxID=1869181 RepID=UPI0031E40F24
MQFRLILGCLLLLSGVTMAQDGTLFIVDSVEATNGLQLSPDQIAFINVVKSPTLQAKYGAKAANGIIYIESKPFARKRYNRLFASVSPAFEAAIKKYGDDSKFQYVLNSLKIDSSSVNLLAALDSGTIANIEVINAAALKKRYEVRDKKVGIIITGK